MQNLPAATDGVAANHIDDEFRTSKIDDNSINSELQLIFDEQELINTVFARPFPTISILSATDTELEYELANLMGENSDNANIESPSLATTVKSNDARWKWFKH